MNLIYFYLIHVSILSIVTIAIASRPIPILFYANKMDIPAAFTEGEVARELLIETIKDRPWNIL